MTFWKFALWMDVLSCLLTSSWKSSVIGPQNVRSEHLFPSWQECQSGWDLPLANIRPHGVTVCDARFWFKYILETHPGGGVMFTACAESRKSKNAVNVISRLYRKLNQKWFWSLIKGTVGDFAERKPLITSQTSWWVNAKPPGKDSQHSTTFLQTYLPHL